MTTAMAASRRSMLKPRTCPVAIPRMIWFGQLVRAGLIRVWVAIPRMIWRGARRAAGGGQRAEGKKMGTWIWLRMAANGCEHRGQGDKAEQQHTGWGGHRGGTETNDG
jgi:hypothetical protein